MDAENKPVEEVEEVEEVEGPKVRVLAIGPDAKQLVESMFPPEKIIIDWVSARIPKRLKNAKYGQVIVYNALSKVSWRKVDAYFKEIASMVAEGGGLHVFEPSLEWFIRQYSQEGKPKQEWIIHLFGDQTDEERYNKCAILLSQLRELFYISKLPVIGAREGLYMIGDVEAGLNYVHGVRE